MLSIGKLGASQAGYYEKQVAKGRDDYYSGRGEAPGEWAGRGARALGLTGTVRAEQFNALMANLNPADPELAQPLRLTAQGQVVGFDLTFSAPKSVSVLFAVGDEHTSGVLIEAHEAATRAALSYVEDEAVKVRRGKGGARIETADGVIAAAYRHRMSRALDPQLHTHVVCANAAQGPDGRWTALDGRHLYAHAKTAGYLYQAHLRAEVRDRLGLQWGEVHNGMAELTAIDPQVLAHFSTRRREILEAAQEAGVDDLNSERGQYLTVSTRERKQYGKDTHIWREEVRARAAEHGLDQSHVDALLDTGRDPIHTETAAEQAPATRPIGDVLAGPDGLTAMANTFQTRDVLRELAATAAQGARVSDVRAEGEAFAGRGDVLATASDALTTQDLVASERRLIAAAVGRTQTDTAVVDEATVDRALAAADRPLTDEQRNAVRAIATSGNGVDVIEALAGTGKTFTAGTLRQVYEDAGVMVVGVAPTGRAVRELTDEAGIPAMTLDRALMDLDRYGVAAPPHGVVILDEAGMASTRQTERLLAACDDVGAKVICIGGPGQLASVQAGGWLRAVGERVGRHELTQVMRQRALAERVALAQLHDGAPTAYIDWADTQGRIVTHHPDQPPATAAALVDYHAAVAEVGVHDAVLIARSNDTRTELNQLVRAARQDAGELGEQLTYGPTPIAVGDRVICRRNDTRVDVDNGTRGTVRAVTREAVILQTDAGPTRVVPAAYAAEHLEHAYCLTGHGMQGGTVERAVVVAAPRELTAGWSYTALSRARGATQLHIDATDRPSDAQLERAELAPADQPSPTPDRVAVLARVADRMTVRDDEDLAVDQVGDLPAPGAANDPALTDTQAPGVLHDGRIELADLRARAHALRAQAASLPVRDLERLERLEAERDLVTGQRHHAVQAAEQIPPAPAAGRFGRSRPDAHAHERARLTAAIDAADVQIRALEHDITRTQATVGPAADVRTELDGLTRGARQLDRQADRLRDELVTRDLATPPAWARQLLGDQPHLDSPGHDAHTQALKAASAYRHDHQIADDTPGLGDQPADERSAREHRRVHELIDRALGRPAPSRDQPGLDR